MAQQDTIPLWNSLPDDVLIQIFAYLPASFLLNAGLVCQKWQRVALDDILWRELFYRHWQISRTIVMVAGKSSWMQEYKRLYYHTPCEESEVITTHKDQVLHVSFSHNGKMFATCSKDGFIMVWDATSYPVLLKYKCDMRNFSWKYTQYSQFNMADTLLMVSGVHFGSSSTSGEIAVFNLQDQFKLESRVINKPYDVFGTWYNDSHLLSGNLYWTGHLHSCSALSLNYAYQETDSPNESVVMKLYRFHNVNASSIRTIMIANHYQPPGNDGMTKENSVDENAPEKSFNCGSDCSGGYVFRESQQRVDEPVIKLEDNSDKENSKSCHKFQHLQLIENDLVTTKLVKIDDLCSDKTKRTIQYNDDYREAEKLRSSRSDSLFDEFSNVCDKGNISSSAGQSKLFHTENTMHSSLPKLSHSIDDLIQSPSTVSVDDYSSETFQSVDTMSPTCTSHSGGSICSSNVTTEKSSQVFSDKYLIFTMGSQTYTPHQVGIKLIMSLEAELSLETQQGHGDLRLLPDVEENNHRIDRDEYDCVDHLIDLHGHIIGMCLSPDHRYLYVNSRPWPKNYFIDNPLYPPPIAQEIDIHVIDLVKMKEVGTMHQSHKAYTPNDECFFIFLDVCNEYVASGAEDKHGYLWDRHYGICINKFPHTDVVNSVAFNPKNPQMLVTVSDDHAIKIWRSRWHKKEVETRDRKLLNKEPAKKIKPPNMPI